VLAFSDIIDFLLHLLGDEAAQKQFATDPQGTLERAGLQGVTAQDIRDARLQLADTGAVHATNDGSPPHHSDDPVHEIGYTARHYAADHSAYHNADHGPVDHGSTLVSIDDRDTLFFQTISDDDVTVTDNSVAISGSFNEDNSSSTLTAIQANGSFNSDDDTSVDVNDSFNSDDDLTAVQDNDVTLNVAPSAEPDAPDPSPALDAPGPTGLDAAEAADPADPADAPDTLDAADPEPAEIDDVPADAPIDVPAGVEDDAPADDADPVDPVDPADPADDGADALTA
jgi:hypothetical protein